MGQRLIWIFWPSFLVAIAAVGIVFSMVDPHDIEHIALPRLGVYTVGFFCFWALAAASSAITVFLQHDLRRAPRRRNTGV